MTTMLTYIEQAPVLRYVDICKQWQPIVSPPSPNPYQ